MSEKDTAGIAGSTSNSELNDALGSYVAMCKVTVQINEDVWKTYTACKVITAETTMKDIIAWYRAYHKYGFQIEITEAT